MTFSVKFFRIMVFSLMLVFFSCKEKKSVENKFLIDGMMVITRFYSEYYEGERKIYTLRADTGFYFDTTDTYKLKKVEYKREDGEDVLIYSDSSIVKKESIDYFGNVKIVFSDSMELYTDSIVYLIKKDSLKTDDSILMVKKNNKMLTCGMVCYDNFKRIIFNSPILIYDQEK